MNKFVIELVIFYFNPIYAFDAIKYPNVIRDDSVIDDYFGTKVKDPYRWLEDPNSMETIKFIDEQNSITKPYIQSNPNRISIKESFSELYNYPKYGIPAKQGSKYYYSENTGLKDQSVIYVMDSFVSQRKVFIDPNKFSKDGSISLNGLFFSKNGNYCAYTKTVGGSDWVSIQIKNTITGKDLPETLTRIKFTSPQWSVDNLGFFYGLYDEYEGSGSGTDAVLNQNQKLYYHRLFTKQSEDILITSFPNNPLWIIGDIVVTRDGKYIHIFPNQGSMTAWFYAELDGKPINKALEFIPIKEQTEASYSYIANDANYVYIITDRFAPNFRLVKIDLNHPQETNWIEILPEKQLEVLENAIVVNKNYLVVTYMKDVVNTLEIYNVSDGKPIYKVNITLGTVSELSGRRDENEFFYKTQSFLSPGIIYKFTFYKKGYKIRVFRESRIKGLDTKQFQEKQVFFRSKDNTDIPMFIISRKNISLDGSNPTLLYGYGGFSVSITPQYNPLAVFYIQNLNGVYASANIREYGENWHRSGMLLNKQNVFDDFASAAEYLIQNKYTRRDRLTINGASNGGLLAAASSNQRPDLFGCTVANVGVMDMLRFQLFTIGYAWIEDYGDPIHNETEFKYVYKYSPLHNIPENTKQYPAMLVMTGDHDDRVVPSHSLKLIAELQYKLGNKLLDTPLMIRVDKDSGHGSGKSTTKRIEEIADMVSFIIKALGIDYKAVRKPIKIRPHFVLPAKRPKIINIYK